MDTDLLNYIYVIPESKYQDFLKLNKQVSSINELILILDLNNIDIERILLKENKPIKYSKSLKPNNILLIPFKLQDKWYLTPWRILKNNNQPNTIAILSILDLENIPYNITHRNDIIKFLWGKNTNNIQPRFPYKSSYVRKYLTSKRFLKSFPKLFLDNVQTTTFKSDNQDTLKDKFFLPDLIDDILPNEKPNKNNLQIYPITKILISANTTSKRDGVNLNAFLTRTSSTDNRLLNNKHKNIPYLFDSKICVKTTNSYSNTNNIYTTSEIYPFERFNPEVGVGLKVTPNKLILTCPKCYLKVSKTN